jgi:NAD-dependent dihydropyrimidine dehydrogenase PreA subunit
MRNFQYLKAVTTLKLDENKCVGCCRCVEVCPHEVFTMRKKRSKICDLNACIECGACALNCPVTAIKVDAGVGCASGLITEWLQERGLTRTPRGC